MPTSRLKHVAIMRAGGTPRVDDEVMWSDDGLPWVAIGDLTRSRRVTATERRVSRMGIESKNLPIGKPGTLLFAMYASVGALGILGVAGTWNQAILGIEPVTGRADSRFLSYWLEHLRPQLAAMSRSNTQDNLNAEQVANLEFTGPPIGDQGLIADFLDAETARIDAVISKKRTLYIKIIERLMSSIDSAIWAFEELTTVAPLRRVARFVDYRGATPSKASSGIPLVTASHVRDGRLDLANDPQWLDEQVYSEWMRRGWPEFGDVLLTTEAPLGNVAQVVDSRIALAQRVVLLKPNTFRVRADFLAFALRAPTFKHTLFAHATGSTALGIKADRLKGLSIPVPSLDRQDCCIDALCRLEHGAVQLRLQLNRQIDLLLERRQALITAAVTGEMEVPGVSR